MMNYDEFKNTLNNIKDDDLIKIDGKTYKLTHYILIEKLEKSEIYVELLKLQIKELLCNKDTKDGF